MTFKPLDLTGFNPWPQDLQGWQSTCPIFEELIRETKPKVIVEIGTWKGGSAINMAKLCKYYGCDTKIYCIDTWLGASEFWTNPTPERNLHLHYGYPQIYYQFLSNVVRNDVADCIIPVPLPSSIGIHLVPNADLIYIDGDHSFDGCLQDVTNAYSKLNPGGVMFGDDYCNNIFQVKEAVHTWHEKYLMEAPIEYRGRSIGSPEQWFWLTRKES